MQVMRLKPKGFRQLKMVDGNTEWSVTDVRTVPYRLPELLADPARWVVIVEGEKDADNLARIGVLATCNAGGAGKWTAEHAAFLRGRCVVVIPDNDEPGRKHARSVARSLFGVAAAVRILELPDLPAKGDVSDWLDAGGSKEELQQLVELAPDWVPESAEPWPEILRFEQRELPAFPTDVLPPVLRDWVDAESHATQTPLDLAGLLSLAVCSAALARKVEVEPRPGWREPVNLFVAVLMGPGNRKSAVFSDALKPLRYVEEDLKLDLLPHVARAQSERRQAEGKLKRLEKRVADKGDVEARTEAGNLAAELAMQIEVAMPRLIVDDATVEKLAMMLAEQDGRIASMSPEGGVFDLMAGLYSKSGMAQFNVYLMAHAGDDLVTDRVSRPSVCVKKPALTCAYAMQPQVITGLAGNPAFRSRGLLARFLYACPKSWIGQRQIGAAPVSKEISFSYFEAIRKLAVCKEKEVTLNLDEDAASQLTAWESEIESMLGDGGQMEMMRDWGAKLAGATLRMAAIIHCVQHGVHGRISSETLGSAIEIARYLIPHAQATFNLMLASDGSCDDDAQYVLRWIERHERREFTKSEAQHHGKRRFPRAEDIDPSLTELTRRGYIRLQPNEVVGPGRPPSPTYVVNPAAFVGPHPELIADKSYGLAAAPLTDDCGNIGSASEQYAPATRLEVKL